MLDDARAALLVRAQARSHRRRLLHLVARSRVALAVFEVGMTMRRREGRTFESQVKQE